MNSDSINSIQNIVYFEMSTNISLKTTYNNNHENHLPSSQTPSDPKIKFVKLKTTHFII